MKVLLVFAGIAETGFNSSGQKLKLIWINHGLASIAGSVKKAGHEVNFIDLRQLSSWDEFKAKVTAYAPQVVGITMMSVDYETVTRAIELIKEIDKRIKVVVGGPHPNLALEEVKANTDIDHIVLGEGEISFVELLGDIESGKAVNRVIHGVKPDLDALPFADREIFAAGEMPIDHFLRIPFVTIIAGRGCIYNCSFCQPAERMIFGPVVRRRSVKNVIDELKLLRERSNFQSLMIHDDCLTEDRAWVMDFCGQYRKNGFKQPFICQSRADIICKNEDMVKMMACSGLAMFLIGFESGNQRVLNFLRKGTKVEQNYKAAEICKRYGVRVWANYMLGIPTETKEEALDTLAMIRKIKPYRASPAFFTPHPGSDLYKYCEENGLSLMKSHSDYSRSPDSPKIKGVDYLFLREVLEESKKIPLSVKIRRKIDHTVERKIKKHVIKFKKKIGLAA
ncbi:MAG: B12-binding domain-containing radical SAM protein [Candidatus Omnitrophica bacterium]|nr:B12-binding domain-containing radical SAM protein [Candidatus Omnitrophota bacterium]MBU1808052.1 B12-binding domain-containing radical SAM protein [Candidatus Omnitrophota bacterium]